MKLIDMYDGKMYSLYDLYKEYKVFRSEDPENHADNFQTELFEILIATVNGRNDMDVVGMTAKEINNYIIRIRKRIWEA